VNFNKSYLDSIFLNLITNSIRYADPERKIIIDIKSRITRKGNFQLLFSDNGLGMDMQKVGDEIFGLYKVFHKHPDSKGMGLYLVHSQVTALGGTITVDSKVGVGTTFTITF
jgi:signal transduction histidine kinase